MNKLAKDELLERLVRLDEEVDLMFDNEQRFKMIIVGGSALILHGVIKRATYDIDALDASPEIQGLFGKYDINTNVKAYINNFPYNYEDRLVSICTESRKIDFYTPSLEDLVVAKLYAGREKDLQDIASKGVIDSIDWNKLEHLAKADDEAKASTLNDSRYSEFLDTYNDYVERWGPCKNLNSEDFSLDM